MATNETQGQTSGEQYRKSSYETCHLFCDVPLLISMVPVVVRTKIFSEKADRCLRHCPCCLT